MCVWAISVLLRSNLRVQFIFGYRRLFITQISWKIFIDLSGHSVCNDKQEKIFGCSASPHNSLALGKLNSSWKFTVVRAESQKDFKDENVIILDIKHEQGFIGYGFDGTEILMFLQRVILSARSEQSYSVRQSKKCNQWGGCLSQNVSLCSSDPSFKLGTTVFSNSIRGFSAPFITKTHCTLSEVSGFTSAITAKWVFYPKWTLGANRYHNSSPLEVVKSFN